MAYELYYTSAPRGLRPQTSGICTVGLTRGFPAPFISRIEALSGYRKLSDDADSSACPIAFSHWIVEGGGVNRHVLSAVRMAPPDHTGRSNKFAHHLLLREEECVAAGPAWLLQQAGVMADAWTGEPRELPQERRMPTSGRVVAGVCASWQRVGGDSGWAGVLANAAMLDPAKACSVIVPRGTESLDLIAEALLLLPAEFRWRVTFSSYFMEPIAGVRCSWRFCFDGTAAATAARAGGGTCIDLCARAPCTRTGRFIDFARTGVMPAARAAASEAQPGVESDSSGRIPLAPEKPVDFDAVLGRAVPSVSRTRSAIDDAAADAQRPRTMPIVLVAATCFFALLSVILLVLLMQSEKPAASARTNPVAPAAPPAVPKKIPDSQPAPIQAVAQPADSQVEIELRRELLTAKDRIAQLERELAGVRASVAPPTDVDPVKPALAAARPRVAPQDQTPIMPTVSSEWIVKSLPPAQKDSFGKWNGSEKLVECVEGAQWRWLGLKERGGFVFDEQGITMRLAKPGVQPARIAELKCLDGWLTLAWTVTSAVDSAERGRLERLKKEVEQVGLMVGDPAGSSAKWLRFVSSPTKITVGAEPREMLVPAPSHCAPEGGKWSDITTTVSISVPGCEQGGVVVLRDANRSSTDTRFFEVLFEWPADCSDEALTKVRDDILALKEEITTKEQTRTLLGSTQDPDNQRERERINKEIKQMEAELSGQEKYRDRMEEKRKQISDCVKDKKFLFGPKEGIPSTEFVLRIERPTEVRK